MNLARDDGILRPGCVLHNTFRVRHILAEGGMGMVYLATHERLPGLFVVKTVHPDLTSADQGAARLRQEAEVLAGLNHPNIVRVFDFNETPSGMPYLVLEFLDGRNLNDILKTGHLDPWEVTAVVRQIASALGAAHVCNVVHRDLKPENVLIVPVVGQDDVIKLIDFGASKVSLSTRINTRAFLIGTPNYMSPEQVCGGSVQIDARSDQFALAVTTYEMLAGRRPFSDDDPVAVLHQIVKQPTPPLGLEVDWIPRAIEQVLARGMAKDPAARYATVLEFSEAFDQAVRTDVGGTPQALRLLATRHQESLVNVDAASPSEDRRVVASAVRTVGLIQPRSDRRRGRGLMYLIATAAAGVLFLHSQTWPVISAWWIAP